MALRLMTGSSVRIRLRSDEGEISMRGTFGSTGGRLSPPGGIRRRSGDGPRRSVGVRAMGVALTSTVTFAVTAVIATTPALAEGSGSAGSTVQAPPDPGFFGLGAVGLFWLLAGLIALTVGIVLATRRERTPITGQLPGPSAPGTIGTRTGSDDEPGGARR